MEYQVECIVHKAGYVRISANNEDEARSIVENNQFNDSDFEPDEFSGVLEVEEVIDVLDISD